VNRDARLKWMDEHGIQACLMLPTLGVGVEHQLRHDPEATFANLRAFNRWLEDDWGFSYKDRIIGVPLLSLVDAKLAVDELERVIGAYYLPYGATVPAQFYAWLATRHMSSTVPPSSRWERLRLQSASTHSSTSAR
jgi:hypothetical protein